MSRTAMSEDDYIEFRFVKASLKRYGFEVRSLMAQSIDDKNIIKEGELLHQIAGTSFTVKRAGEKGGVLQFFFPDYGRFIEINYFRRKTKSISDLRNEATNEIWNLRKNRKKSKKDSRWYTQNVYGPLNDLISELMFGLTEAVRLDLRKNLIDPFKSNANA